MVVLTVSESKTLVSVVLFLESVTVDFEWVLSYSCGAILDCVVDGVADAMVVVVLTVSESKTLVSVVLFSESVTVNFELILS